MEFQSGYERNVETIPVGELGIIALKSCETLGKKIDAHIVNGEKNASTNISAPRSFALTQETPT